MIFSSSTKASLLAAFIFVVDKKTDLISAPHALVYFGVVIFFVYFKLSSLLLGITDPFIPFENLFCAVCMGGVFDVIQETFYGKPKAAEENGDAAKPKAGERENHVLTVSRTEDCKLFLYRIRMTERSSWKKSSNLPRKTTNINKHERYIRYDLCYTSNLYTRIIKIFTFYFGVYNYAITIMILC